MAQAASSNLEYDVLRNNRQERKRTTTDVAGLVIYVMFVIVWMGIAIYALSQTHIPPFRIVKFVSKFLWEHLFFSPAIFCFTWLSILLIVFYFIMLRWCTKFTVYLTVFLEFLFTTLILILIGVGNTFIMIPILVFCYLIFWIKIQILRKSDIQMVCNIIVDACKTSIGLPFSLLIGLLNLFTCTIGCIFVAIVIDCLLNPKFVVCTLIQPEMEIIHKYNEYCAYNVGLIITFSIISGWILIVDYLCMMFVLHGVFTDWCKTENKSTIPKVNIFLRHLFYAYRYHIGSFAMMSIPIVPIIQIIRTICSNIHMIEMKFKESLYNIYCFLIIIENMFTNSSVACASYGKCFYPSMKDAFKVLIQNSMKFTATRLVIAEMILFGWILIPGIMIGVVGLHVAILNPFNCGIYFLVTGIISLIITRYVLFIYSSAVDSVLFCHLEHLLKNETESVSNSHENDEV